MSDAYNHALSVADQRGELRVSSPAFDDGDPIPDAHAYEGGNVNPPLEIAGVPEDATSLALVVDDPDAVDPAGKIWVHWLVWNLDPERDGVPRAWDPTDAVEGENDFGEVGYGGPKPPDGEHTYRFKLYALDTDLGLPTGASAEALGNAIEDHVVAQTQVTGTYAP
ncbi:Raf kinase inhibitor-like protein, YbhB/YbcL family [Halovivax ruber XH-70]|uniref:Raf kinase inhibitor-like protein, YbhB/YbcL family n=1 Tax=Halovivax ruber (strain DSM 18193 / JCM 13892 / XH-70) TaxID=797302 RepID=L0IC24_HALRX|nr:YbhB/YbcL family Raf kinase inhibitor-like protein [Halovivax ruber]AGB15517.1 Raf kinase inhibitor-like protein, YbhB/YbcL family [Halovivax ruber XH-70]